MPHIFLLKPLRMGWQMVHVLSIAIDPAGEATRIEFQKKKQQSSTNSKSLISRTQEEENVPQILVSRNRSRPVNSPSLSSTFTPYDHSPKIISSLTSFLSPYRLLDLSSEQLRDVVHARARRRFNRGLKRKPMGLIKKLRKAKQEAKPNEKPDLVKTHLRNMIVVPEMIGSVIGIYSGKEFNQVEIKPEMVGHYLGEFSISYKPVKHGRPGIGATHSSRFIPLK